MNRIDWGAVGIVLTMWTVGGLVVGGTAWFFLEPGNALIAGICFFIGCLCWTNPAAFLKERGQ